MSTAPRGRFSGRRDLVIVPRRGGASFGIRRRNSRIAIGASRLYTVISGAANRMHFASTSNGRVLTRSSSKQAFAPIRIRNAGKCAMHRMFRSTNGSRTFCNLNRRRTSRFGCGNGGRRLFRCGAGISMPFVISGGGCNIL